MSLSIQRPGNNVAFAGRTNNKNQNINGNKKSSTFAASAAGAAIGTAGAIAIGVLIFKSGKLGKLLTKIKEFDIHKFFGDVGTKIKGTKAGEKVVKAAETVRNSKAAEVAKETANKATEFIKEIPTKAAELGKKAENSKAAEVIKDIPSKVVELGEKARTSKAAGVITEKAGNVLNFIKDIPSKIAGLVAKKA